MGDLLLVFCLEGHRTGTFALFQSFLEFYQYFVCLFGLLVTTCLRLFLHFRDAAVDGFKVFYLKFCVDDFLVADRIHLAVHMHDIIVVEATEHMQDRICFADIGKEFIS